MSQGSLLEAGKGKEMSFLEPPEGGSIDTSILVIRLILYF